MPQPQQITKAQLLEINLDTGDEIGEPVKVQFNPQTLKVNFTNQLGGGDQSGGAAIQFIKQSTTKLALELWFDVTIPGSDDANVDDVRQLTRNVAHFLEPGPGSDPNQKVPPGVRFLWGTFMFDGVMESLNENLEFFDEEGRPLRASVAISLVQQKFQFEFNPNFAGAGTGNAPGTQRQEPARAGDTVQRVAARAGRPGEWQSIARDNNIENPRQLPPGSMLNTRPRRR